MHIRLFLYKLYGARIGRKALIYKGCEIRDPRNLVIGNGSIIGDDAVLDARAGLTIGENVATLYIMVPSALGIALGLGHA